MKRDRQPRQGRAVGELPVGPKAVGKPFGGSELTFCITDDGRLLAGAHNLRQLVRGSLRGRARVHLAGEP